MAKFNPKDPKASDTFCGLIQCAAQVFTYRLVLGGMYNYTPHCEEILEHLKAIVEITEEYDRKTIEV